MDKFLVLIQFSTGNFTNQAGAVQPRGFLPVKAVRTAIDLERTVRSWVGERVETNSWV
jgi:hypothetical protein